MRPSTRMLCMALIALGCLYTPPIQAQLTDEQIRQSIQRYKAYLYNTQNEQGHWDQLQRNDTPHNELQYGGRTALITYALLTSGDSYQDPKLARAIQFLRSIEMRGTYAVGLRSHVWAALPPQFEPLLQADQRWLTEAQHPELGHYNYSVSASQGFDNSTTQYGVLGMWEAAKRGIAPNVSYWRKVEEHFFRSQTEAGGWNYRGGGSNTGSMTASGLVCLFITQEFLHRRDYSALGRTDDTVQQRIDAGLNWLSENFKPNENPGASEQWLYYYLYGVERVGLASGRKYFGNLNWYAAGAQFLSQRIPDDTADAAFGLLFLVRGRHPVLINKLQIPDYPWNNRPSDVAQLTAWVSDEAEKQMLWQVVSIDAPAEDWLDAPILYLASHQPLELTDQQVDRIRRYIQLGGLLITTADGGNDRFNASIEQLHARLFPQYPTRAVAPDDEIFNLVYKVNDHRTAANLDARSINNGIRHLALHFPKDTSWTLHSARVSEAAVWQLMTNIYFYATEKGRNRARLEQHAVLPQIGAGATAPEVTVGRAQYEGNWNPEPLAWQVQAVSMYNDNKARVTTKPYDLAQLPQPAEAPLIHITGTEAVQFTEQQITSIRNYVGAGGLILIENAGGRGEFTNSATQMLNTAFPDNLARPISLRSPIITGQTTNGYDISIVDYRPYALLRLGRAGGVAVPRLLAINFGDQPRIIISPEDLTEAMLHQPVWGVMGYDSDSATKIIANLVLSAMPKQPATPFINSN